MTKNSTEIDHPMTDIHIIPITGTSMNTEIIHIKETSGELQIIPMTDIHIIPITGTRMITEIDHPMIDIHIIPMTGTSMNTEIIPIKETSGDHQIIPMTYL